jgi:hypothetical protein
MVPVSERGYNQKLTPKLNSGVFGRSEMARVFARMSALSAVSGAVNKGAEDEGAVGEAGGRGGP